MFPNSSELRLEKDVRRIMPVSKMIKTSAVPVNVQRITNNSFRYCDVKQQHLSTHIIQCSFDKHHSFKQQTLQQFMGEYEFSCFNDDYTFLANRQGDIAAYDHLSKNTVFVEKQHPSLFHPLQMHPLGEMLMTCGGNTRNSQGENEKIVKLWRTVGEELEMRCRIVTGHSRPIENSLILGRNRVVSLSSDLTVRSSNLCTQQIEAIFPVSMTYYSGCEVDWNSAILGGIGPNLSIFDFRGKRVIEGNKLPFNVIQISAFTRINTHHYLFSNANAIYCLDLRKMNAQKVGQHDGQRISAIKVLGPDTLLLGNHDKSLQMWSVCNN